MLQSHADQDDKEKEKLKAGLTGAILSEKPNVKVSETCRLDTCNFCTSMPCLQLSTRCTVMLALELLC